MQAVVQNIFTLALTLIIMAAGVLPALGVPNEKLSGSEKASGTTPAGQEDAVAALVPRSGQPGSWNRQFHLDARHGRSWPTKPAGLPPSNWPLI